MEAWINEKVLGQSWFENCTLKQAAEVLSNVSRDWLAMQGGLLSSEGATSLWGRELLNGDLFRKLLIQAVFQEEKRALPLYVKTFDSQPKEDLTLEVLVWRL